MSYQHTIAQNITANGGSVSKSNDYSAAQECGFSDTISAGATTIPNMGIDVSAAVSVVMQCDRDVTITVNDDGTPDATISLLANKPLVWTNDAYFTNPLGSVDVTSMKATLAAGADADLFIEVIFD